MNHNKKAILMLLIDVDKIYNNRRHHYCIHFIVAINFAMLMVVIVVAFLKSIWGPSVIEILMC